MFSIRFDFEFWISVEHCLRWMSNWCAIEANYSLQMKFILCEFKAVCLFSPSFSSFTASISSIEYFVLNLLEERKKSFDAAVTASSIDISKQKKRIRRWKLNCFKMQRIRCEADKWHRRVLLSTKYVAHTPPLHTLTPCVASIKCIFYLLIPFFCRCGWCGRLVCLNSQFEYSVADVRDSNVDMRWRLLSNMCFDFAQLASSLDRIGWGNRVDSEVIQLKDKN